MKPHLQHPTRGINPRPLKVGDRVRDTWLVHIRLDSSSAPENYPGDHYLGTVLKTGIEIHGTLFVEVDYDDGAWGVTPVSDLVRP